MRAPCFANRGSPGSPRDRGAAEISARARSGAATRRPDFICKRGWAPRSMPANRPVYTCVSMDLVDTCVSMDLLVDASSQPTGLLIVPALAEPCARKFTPAIATRFCAGVQRAYFDESNSLLRGASGRGPMTVTGVASPFICGGTSPGLEWRPSGCFTVRELSRATGLGQACRQTRAEGPSRRPRWCGTAAVYSRLNPTARAPAREKGPCSLSLLRPWERRAGDSRARSLSLALSRSLSLSLALSLSVSLSLPPL